MELPKNITQIGEVNRSCRIYVEDYVISYIKQLNNHARDKDMAVALYGTRQEENGVSYLFFYGACRLNFLQRESRHLSQAVQQEAEEQRQKYFMQYEFLGYCMLNGEMVEGFQICQQGVCRYIAGYAQFYEKNDCMLAFMLEDRRETVRPETVNQEKYDEVKKRQEERRLQSEEKGGQALRGRFAKPVSKYGVRNLRHMRYAAAAVFVLLCVAGYATVSDGNSLEDLQVAALQMFQDATSQQIPDSMDAADHSEQAGIIVAEDKLTDAILQENMAGAGTEVQEASSDDVEVASMSPTVEPTPEATPEPTPEITPEPTLEPTPEPMPEATPEPVSYTIQRGDTLIGICIAKYGSDERVAEVCSFNGITNPDDIKVGQKILLP